MSSAPRSPAKPARVPRDPKPSHKVRPRTKPAAVRREELLDKGMAATSVDEIVGAADVAKGTFYLHFASKEALLLGLQDRFVAQFRDKVDRAIARKKPEDCRARLCLWIRIIVDYHLDNVALHDLIFHTYHPHEREAMLDAPVIHDLTAMLSAGAAAGEFAVDDPKLTAMMLFYALHAAADVAVIQKLEGAGRKQLMERLESFVLRGVGITP